MANSKLIVIEGPQGAGKTTITDYIRHKLPYTNLYRLNGSNDSSPTGKAKSVEMYTDLLDYIEKLQNKNINLLFDRTFFTEAIYCRLGFKEFSYDDVFDVFLERLANFDFETYYITLYLSDTNEFETRLARSDKAIIKYAKFDKDSSIKQQDAYLKMADEVKQEFRDKIKVINIDTCIGLEGVKEEIMKYLG
jgi:thymidylate kinase